MLAFFCTPYFKRPMQDEVVRAVRKAVSAATIIFTASSIMRFLVIYLLLLKLENPTFLPYLADAVRVAAVYEDFNHTPIL